MTRTRLKLELNIDMSGNQTERMKEIKTAIEALADQVSAESPAANITMSSDLWVSDFYES